jgi:hypothetical protein
MPGPSSSMAAPEDMRVASEDAFSSLTTSGISDSSTDATSTAVSSSFCAAPTPSILNKQKTSPVWKFFTHFDPVHHPDKKNRRICLVCKDMGVDKCISIGNYYSPAALVNHLRSVHQEQYHEYLVDSNEIKENERKKNKVHQQTDISLYFSTAAKSTEQFRDQFAEWVVAENMPLITGQSSYFQKMIKSANKTITPPDYREF